MHRFLSALYVLVMGLVWLDPLDVLTDTEDVWLFGCFLTLFIISRWLAFRPWLPPLLTVLGLVGLFYAYYFFPANFMSLAWLKAWGAELAASFPQLLLRDWLNMSPMARTFYFFLVLWLFYIFLWRHVYHRRRVLSFIFLSVVYLSVLDTFTPYDGRGALVLTFVAGLLFLLWLRVLHLAQQEPFRVRVQWLIGGLVLVMLATSVAYASPKPGPAWPDPIPWIVHGGAAGEAEGVVRKVGYGYDDAHLGGAFVEDNGVVMRVRTTAPVYWRGESKDVYTGKGWLNSRIDRRADRLLALGESVPADYPRLFDSAAVDVVPVRQVVEWAGEALPPQGRNRYPLFHQGMITAVTDADARVFVWGQDAYGIFALQQPLTFAQMQGVLPVVDEERLSQTGQQYPKEILRHYLQLPAIPERVRRLAEELTGEADNPYDKVKAVEAYLKSDEFTYDARNVAVPDEDEDFVDVFLFESKRGYCDYFSTAMVILLRSVGIPARWVKGFTAGELVKKRGADDGAAWVAENGTYYEGTVYNRHAHSWVEVYFAGIGWLPFEPTKGFSLPQTVTAEDDLTPANDDPTSQDEEESAEEAGDDTESTPETDWTAWLAPLENSKTRVGWLAVGLSAAGIFFLVGWFCRDLIWFWWRLNRWRRKTVTKDDFLLAYRKLLAAMERQAERRPAETLREYVRRMQMEPALSPLTNLYETLRFGNAAAFGQDVSWEEPVRRLYAVYRQIWRQRWKIAGRKTVLSRTLNN